MTAHKYSNDRTKININVKLLEASAKDKEALELVALTYAILAHYRSGAVHNVSVSRICEIAHVSKTKACRLLKQAKLSRFFTFDKEKNILTIHTPKHLEVKDTKDDRKYKQYCSSFVYKLNKSEIRELTFAGLIKKLRTIVLLYSIQRASSGYRLTGMVTRKPKDKKKNQSPYEAKVPLKFLRKSIGMSESTVSKYLSKVDNLTLTKIPSKRYTILYSNYEQGLFDSSLVGLKCVPCKKKGLVFFFDGCTYRLGRNTFRHWIWHYRLSKKKQERADERACEH